MNEGLAASDLNLTLSGISTELLLAELSARKQEDDVRPACGSGGAKGAYNTPLHVAALFLILILSVLACAFPIVVRRFPSLPVPHRVLFLSRHFGTGVLIATAFCHLLPTAFVSLTDPCLPPFWSERYVAMPGLIAMMSVFAVIGIEMFFATRGAGHSHSYELSNGQEEAGRKAAHKGGSGHAQRPTALKRYRTGSFGSVADSMMSSSRPGSQRGHSSVSTHSAEASKHATHHHPSATATKEEEASTHTDDDESDLDLDELGSEDDPLTPTKRTRAPFSHRRNEHPESSDLDTQGSAPADEQKQILQVFLLEAGILFHSIFIGMALSVSTGPSFLVLLVAISFHQTFEGLALGSRIASIQSFPPSSKKPWLMALAYGTTTPAGQAIGLLVHGLYDPAGQAGLLMVGCTNAVSSGLLLFAGLVELLAEDFLSDSSYEDLTGRRRLEACAAVVGGSLLMALVGAFA